MIVKNMTLQDYVPSHVIASRYEKIMKLGLNEEVEEYLESVYPSGLQAWELEDWILNCADEFIAEHTQK